MRPPVQQLADRGIASEIDGREMTVYHDRPLSPQVMHDISVLAPEFDVRLIVIDQVELETRLQLIKRSLSDAAITDIGTKFVETAPQAGYGITGDSGPDHEPVVQLLDSLISTAADRGGSDIHIERDEGCCLIRIRIDGVLSEYMRLPVVTLRPLMGRIKIMSGLDITESRRPQDGAFRFKRPGGNIDVRVSTMPGRDIERAVLRLFWESRTRVDLESLGLLNEEAAAVYRALSSQEGLLLVCGPTGSGKTTTIYAMLESLKGRGLNIMTIEDPVEVDLDGIAQSQINPAIGYDFQQGLRALLRQDPDVILVGEIRDGATADAAIRAALTGHLVIATVHANSPAGAISRLVNLGLDQTLVADALVGVFNQRLVRTYCEFCAGDSLSSQGHRSEMPVLFDGCPTCFHTGFRGRRPVIEHVLLNGEDRITLMEGKIACVPLQRLAAHAIELYSVGQIPLFEVCRVAGGRPDDI